MAKLYTKRVGDITFEMYSERGIVAYYMLRVFPEAPTVLLQQIRNGDDKRLFPSIARDAISKLTIFGELGFGNKYGFGNPDGALFFEFAGRSHMIFYEAKLNEKYQQSCKGEYNSTVQGQLELKWRLLTLYLEKIKTEPDVEYIKESAKYADYYSDKDKFYAPSAEEETLAWTVIVV